MSFLTGLTTWLVRDRCCHSAKYVLIDCTIGFAEISLCLVESIIFEAAVISKLAVERYIIAMIFAMDTTNGRWS
tara:strand:+ start:284 stop:505 length:222 start_codon:yes stop_codon:yes gene_type:complete